MGWEVAPGDSQLSNWQNTVFNSDPGKKSAAGKWSKKFLKKFGQGEDISEYGEFADIRSRQANAQANLGMDAMTGAQALLAQSGNTDDINQMQRMQQLGRERIDDAAARESLAARGALVNTAVATNQNESQFRDDFRQRGQIAAMGNRAQDYNSRLRYNEPLWKKLLMQGVAGAAQVGSAFATGGASAACWIAEAIYGVDDARTHLLRFWLNNVWARESVIGALFMLGYRRFGERVAPIVKRNRVVRAMVRPVFDYLLAKAMRSCAETR